MENLKSKVLVVGVTVALVLGIYGVFKSSETVVREVVREVGAMPGQSLELPEFCVNGICTYNINLGLSASNTPISIKNPTNATSSIVWASLRIFTSSSTKATEYFEIATSTVSGATSTGAALIRGQIPTGTGGVWAWEPANATSTHALQANYLNAQTESNLVKPGEWIVMRIASTAPYFYGGTFQMQLKKN